MSVVSLATAENPPGSITANGRRFGDVAVNDGVGQPKGWEHCIDRWINGLIRGLGEVPEWLNGLDSKSSVRDPRTVGSNPTLSAK